MTDNPIAKAFASLFLILGISVLPLMLVMNNVDNQARSAAEAAVQDFADNARSTGVLTKADFEVLKAKLQATGYVYHVEMLHRSKMAIPDDAQGYRDVYKAYNFEDISNIWEENEGVYAMKNGDFYQILITSTTPTIGSKIYAANYGGSGITLNIPAGGMVGNKKE